jgi:hypothetical protein
VSWVAQKFRALWLHRFRVSCVCPDVVALRTSALLLFTLPILLGLAACGAREQPAHTPDTTSAPAPGGAYDAELEPQPRTLAEAEAWLERAQRELQQVAQFESAPGAPAGGLGPAAAEPAAPPAAAPAPAPDRASRDEAAAEQAPASKAEDPCQSACRAYASLSRASVAVCRLDDPAGARCQRAQRIKAEAGQRVASCGCAG